MARPARCVEAMAAGELKCWCQRGRDGGAQGAWWACGPCQCVRMWGKLLRSLLGFLQIQPVTSFLGKLGFEK